MNHAAVTHHLLWTSCTGWIDSTLQPPPQPPPFTNCHIVESEQKVASGFCGRPTSWMSECPGWLSCRMAYSAFCHWKSLRVTGMRSREVGREGDSDQKKGGRQDEEGMGMRKEEWFQKAIKRRKRRLSAVFNCTVLYIMIIDLFHSFRHMEWKCGIYHISSRGRS